VEHVQLGGPAQIGREQCAFFVEEPPGIGIEEPVRAGMAPVAPGCGSTNSNADSARTVMRVSTRLNIWPAGKTSVEIDKCVVPASLADSPATAICLILSPIV
jgi:hypothetical protein